MIRFFILLATALVGALAAWHAALAWSRSLPPGAVPAFLASDARLRLAQTEALLADPGAVATRAAAVRTTARQVLRDDPLNPAALRQIALADMAERPHTVAGANLLALAGRVSRRDLATEFLLIEQAAQQDRVSAALAHYDHALTVFPYVRPKLFPVLAGALDDPAILQALGAFASRKWFRQFPAQALALGANSTAVVDLVTAPRLERNARADLVTQLVAPLIAGGHYADARRLVRLLDGFDARTIDDLSFSPATTDPRAAPLLWSLPESGQVTAKLAGPATLDITIAAEETALVAERITLLTPGSYAVQQTLDYGNDPPFPVLRWEIDCPAAEPADSIWNQLIPSRAGRTTYRARFTVPAGCGAQRWRLIVSGTESAAEVRLSDFSLRQQ